MTRIYTDSKSQYPIENKEIAGQARNDVRSYFDSGLVLFIALLKKRVNRKTIKKT